jgi:hypothetical protein
MVAILNALFRHAHGYLVTSDPDPTKSRGQEAKVENDTVTCGHCGRIVKVPPMCKPEDMTYELCFGCRRNICLDCHDERVRTNTCDVIEKKLERDEARARFAQDVLGR